MERGAMQERRTLSDKPQPDSPNCALFAGLDRLLVSPWRGVACNHVVAGRVLICERLFGGDILSLLGYYLRFSGELLKLEHSLRGFSPFFALFKQFFVLAPLALIYVVVARTEKQAPR
jgi:hypothetical protein